MTQLHRSAMALLAVVGIVGLPGCGGTANPQPSNSPPTASAGQAQAVLKGALVTLDGSASADPDGDRLVYRWTQVAGTAVTLSDAAAARPTFTSPRAAGTLTFSLVVGDGKAESTSAVVGVTVLDQRPVAVTPSSTVTTTGLAVILDGRGSRDPDGDGLSYSWRQIDGPTVALGDWLDGRASFDSPPVSSAVTLSFSLSVSDGELASTPVTTTVIVLPPGGVLAPVVNAGPDQTSPRHGTVALHGSGSDPQGLPLSFRWTQTAGPSVALTQGSYGWNQPLATFTAPSDECELSFRLTADDGVSTATDDIVVHVQNLAPAATASLSPSAPTTLDDLTAAVDARDPDGDAVTLAYGWKRNGVVVAGATAAVLPASETTRGDVISVVVTASDGLKSTTVEAAVTIQDSPPVLAAASAPTRVTHGQTVSFQVTASDPDGDPVGDLALEYGPAGMDVTPAGLVTWTASGPMFDRAEDVHWSVVAKGQPASRLTGTISVQDQQRQYPLRRTGIEIPLWHAGLQVADLDGDGRAEMLVASRVGVYELARSGDAYAQRWMYPFSPGDGDTVQAVAAADVDGDGKQEIFFATGDLVVRLDGVDRREAARYQSGGAFSCTDLVLADIDRDGAIELVCLGTSGSGGYGALAQVVVFDAKTLKPRWQTPALALGATLAVGNVDGDPALEIVTSAGYVFDGITGMNEWAYGPGFGTVVDVGDLDGDGVAEIVGMVDWTAVRGYSAVLKSPIWEQKASDLDALLVKDIDGDGKAEVLVGDGQWGNVTAYRYQPASNTLGVIWQIDSQNHGVTSIGVGDVDGDGAPEFVWGSGATSSGADSLVIAGLDPSIAVEWTNANPMQLDGGWVGARAARVAAGATRLLFAVGSTDSGYDGTRLVALDPATGLLQVSAEVGSNWNRRAALDVADYDHDGIDEALLTTANLYDGYFVAYDFARDAVEWTSGTGTGFGGLGTGAAVTHADLNGDGFDDLVVLTSEGYVYAYDVKTQALIWKSTSLGGYGVDVAVADVDGDGALEIVALSSTRVVVFHEVAGPVRFIEAASQATTGIDLLVADCDGDGKLEIYVLSNGGYSSQTASVTRLDGALQPLGSFTVDAPAQSLHVEDLGFARKNLLLGIGAQAYSYPSSPAHSYVRAVDAVMGAEVWRSPPLWGAVSRNSLSYVDLGGGDRQIAFATAGGMYLTR